MINYNNLISRIESRYNPDSLRDVRDNSIQSIAGIDRDVAKYVKLAMNEVDPIYTQKTLDAGENVKLHLSRELAYNVDFRYQGSVMTRTHIRGVSDIDLITITKKFNDTDYNKAKEYIENSPYLYDIKVRRVGDWLNRFSEYMGDANNDLRLLRLDAEHVLRSHYSICNTTKPKAIQVTNQHFHRDVDVVIASWHDSFEYMISGDDTYKGIYIYDKERNLRLGPDFPFLSIDRINSRSADTGGRLKKMIRFLKNVKVDSEQFIDLSSFDINAICYDISVDEYKNSHYLDLVRVLWLKLWHLCNNEGEMDKLKSVDGSVSIFMYKNAKKENLKRLEREVWNIYNEFR